jgi:dipeptidyl-peptidase-4
MLSAVFAAAIGGAAQGMLPYKPATMTAADYARAEKLLAAGTGPLVSLASVQANWLADGKFWYRGAGGTLYLVDPAAKTKVPCDVGDVACKPDGPVPAAAASGGAPAGRGGRAGGGGGGGRAGGAGVTSPDGKLAAFIRDNNLWMREVAGGKETQLTTDGVKDFGYATNNAGWTKSDGAVVVWSPDSKRIATFQHDGRGVGEMYLASTTTGHPVLQAWKYPLPGDEKIFMIERVIIDVAPAKVTRLKMPADPHRSTLCDHIVCGGSWSDVEWSADSKSLAFVSTSRDHKQANLRVADAATGTVKDLLEEKVATFFESGNGRVNWHYLPDSKEFIWFSQRDNWGQLYLYDLDTLKLKNQITTGDGNVTQLIKIDQKNRLLYFWAVGKEKGRDPYFRHFYRIGFDGKNQTLLTPGDGDHAIQWSPDEKFLIDTYSKPDVPPVVELRDAATGALAVALEKSDISKLVATGWQPPMPISVKCRDGVTDCHGLLYKPKVVPGRKYPIINKIYPGPQTGSVGGRTFSASRGDSNALAALGFVVVEIDGMGTPWRSKKFHEAYYANMGDNTLPDQIAGMKELAKRFPWIDIDRAGIWGHSGGGFATGAAMFRYPDFFKVGISESGNHDNRHYEDDWAEKWQGLLAGPNAGGYPEAANQTHAKNLKGKLLLAHGTLDANVPPNNTLLVVDELVKANKDFDLIMFPNAGHGYGAAGNYMMRKRWDYFTKWLMGVEPPREYGIGR